MESAVMESAVMESAVMESAGVSSALRCVVKELFDVGAVRLGSFKLRSGITSPIYIDLRVIISFPKLMKKISGMMWEAISGEEDASFDVICGVPYTALPFATCMSLEHDVPLIIRRKEGPKEYGTKKALEGHYTKGMKCLVIEDLITTGGSVIEVAASLQQEGLVIKDVIVFLDREQGGKPNIEQKGIRLHSILNISQLLHIMETENMVDAQQLQSIRDFIRNNQLETPAVQPGPKSIPFEQRAQMAHNPLSAQIFQLMARKKTNLAVAIDVTTKKELLQLADELGPEVAIIKTHIDIIEDFDEDLTKQLSLLSQKHDFYIFEDRKFADIGSTVQLQYQSGIYRISDWAHICTVHALPGKGIIEGLKKVGQPKDRGILLLAQMSSEGSLVTPQYTEEVAKMAADHKDFVVGFISRGKIVEDPGVLFMTPGVNLEQSGDSLGQQYISVKQAIEENGSDVIIVGRGIYGASNRQSAASRYRQAAWESYSARVGQK